MDSGEHGADSSAGALDPTVDEFATYEDFLDSQIRPVDLFYLEDEELARELVELGYCGTHNEIMKREEFDARKRALELSRQPPTTTISNSVSDGMTFTHSPFLQELADREASNRAGKLMTIIFLRGRNKLMQEISGYIDYSHRLKAEKFERYFKGEKQLLPKPSDLSYYNWDTQTVTSNMTANYEVIAEDSTGLIFKNRRDRKLVIVDPGAPSPGDSTTRTVFRTKEYLQVIFYDHTPRRKVIMAGTAPS